MTDENTITNYLEKGGKLTSPDNAPPRYRAELLRIMASFVDSELAGAAGFAELINDGPGITARITGARIVLEKLDHAKRVLGVMGEFGANVDRYETVHPWNARIERDKNLGTMRLEGDMRLNVFHYPIISWADAATMNVLMGNASVIQLTELSHCSYQPLADILNEVLPREARHAELGVQGLKKLASEGVRHEIEASDAYWRPRVAASFGGGESTRFILLQRLGLRHKRNDELLSQWEKRIANLMNEILH